MIALVAVATAGVPSSAGASDVIVQGTTDVRDAGLLDDVLVPGFEAKYPQYTLKYIAVGSGQALTNAKAGQGDAVLVHSPTQEKPFVEAGYSYEPIGRAILYSDYVILGPLDDPAGVFSGAAHNAAHAYELIAQAGAGGTANFVSRGDSSGTNTQEKAIWQLTNVTRNDNHEPGDGTATGNPGWYHKAGLGQAATVQLTSQCPFTGGGCYEMTDRGTFNRLEANSTVTNLKVVSDRNESASPGGLNLLTNPFTAYAVNPAKVPTVNLDGAKALLDYLTSRAFQSMLASYPSAQSPAFFADARPDVTISRKPKGRVAAGARIRITGSLENPLPGAPPISGQVVSLERHAPGSAGSEEILATAKTGSAGRYTIADRADRGGRLFLEVPASSGYPPFDADPLLAVGSLTERKVDLGRLEVQAAVSVDSAQASGSRVRLRGHVSPPTGQSQRARLIVLGRRNGGNLHALRRLRGSGSGSFDVQLGLRTGEWRLKVRYRDPGTVLSATSRAVSLSVG